MVQTKKLENLLATLTEAEQEQLNQIHPELLENIKQAIQEEKELSQAFYKARDAMILIDREGRILRWNGTAQALFGYEEPEVIGQPVHELLAPEMYRKKYTAGLETYANTGKGKAIEGMIEVIAKKKDGTEFYAELSIEKTGEQDEIQRHRTYRNGRFGRCPGHMGDGRLDVGWNR